MRPTETRQSGEQRTVPRGTVLTVSALGGFLVTFMVSSVNVALPLIGEEFHASAVILSWIPLAFILVGSVTLLPLGRVADLYGRVRIFTLGMVIYGAMSFASAFAPSVEVLLVLRAVHGLGAAVGGATAMALIVLAYPPQIRGRALGLCVAFICMGLTLGPVVGGLISQNLGWRALFLVVGALSLVNMVLPLWRLRGIEWKEPKRARFDIVGSVVLGIGLTAIMLGFSLLPDIVGVVLIAAGIADLALFVWWELRTAEPLLNIDLFRRNRVFAFSNAAVLINYATTTTMVFLMSLYLQYNRGLDAQTAGLLLVSGPFVQAVCSPFVGRLADRVEPRYLAATGMAICVLGLFGLSFLGLTTPYWVIVLIVCVLGLGTAVFATPATHIVMGSVETRWAGVASATLASMQQIGMSLGQGLITLLLAVEVGRHTIGPADYPQVLTSVRMSFLIFAALGVLGVALALLGWRRGEVERV